jgi:hypothetical protein
MSKVDDFDAIAVIILPFKTDTEPFIDSDAELALSVSLQLFKPIP